MKELNDVKAFQVKFGLGDHPRVPSILDETSLVQRIQLMQEELNEFKEASVSRDLAGQADALVDLVYVTLGTVAIMGLPWQELWDDVQRANMAKVRGVTHRGHNNDVTKPEGWVGPQTAQILLDAVARGTS